MSKLLPHELTKALNDDLETSSPIKGSRLNKEDRVQAPDARYSWREVLGRERKYGKFRTNKRGLND